MIVGRLAHDGADAVVAAPGVRRLDRQIAGTALILAGTAADSVAGWLALAQSDARGLLVHVLAILIWSLGLGIVHPRLAPAPPRAAAEASAPTQMARRLPRWLSGGLVPEVNEWTLVALLLGLVLLPGMAPLGWCLGMCLAAAYRRLRRARAGTVALGPATAQDASPPPAPLLPLSVVEQLMRAGVEPLMDVVSDPSVERRRGAIAILGQQSGPSAVRLLRHFLTDEHPDVRLDASVTLARLEAHAAHAVQEAEAQRATGSAATRRFADACCEYARSGLLDDVSARFYFTEARAALREYLTGESEDAEAWIALARVLRALGEDTEALAALERARTLAPQSSGAHLLGMEIAFHNRAWTTLRALAQQAQAALAPSDPVAIAARWWTESGGAHDAIERPPSGREGATELASAGSPLVAGLDSV